MKDRFFSLGFMSGTSMDGIDASLIDSNGYDDFKPIYNKFYPYNNDIVKNINELREKIYNLEDLNSLKSSLTYLEKKITLNHGEIANNILNKHKEINLIGFHGQTIYHDADLKISKQLGDGKLLSQMTKKTVVYDFRQNDLKHGGQGAPLTPIFHTLLKKDFKEKSILFLNIGGIANETLIYQDKRFFAKDVGPGNCLIDKWIKLNTKKLFDDNGSIAKSGQVNSLVLNQGLDIFLNSNLNKKKSYDINDFDLSFARGLSLEDGAATLIEFTAEIISRNISSNNIFVCGGGRKNLYLIKRIENKIKKKIHNIETLNFDGDFIESQAFAFLAIRAKLNLPISFPETTGCEKPISGGIIIDNY